MRLADALEQVEEQWECRKWTEYGILFFMEPISKERKDTMSGKTAAQATVQPQKDRKGWGNFLTKEIFTRCPSRDIVTYTFGEWGNWDSERLIHFSRSPSWVSKWSQAFNPSLFCIWRGPACAKASHKVRCEEEGQVISMSCKCEGRRRHIWAQITSILNGNFGQRGNLSWIVLRSICDLNWKLLLNFATRWHLA